MTSYHIIAIITSSFVGVAIWRWRIAGLADSFAIITMAVILPEIKQHWQILLILYNENNSLQLTQITEKLQAKTRDDVVSILKKMVKDGLLEADESTRNVKYSLSEKAIKNYFTFNPKDIGTADDIPQVTKHVVKSYLDMGCLLL